MTNNEKLMAIMQMFSDRIMRFDNFPKPECSAEWIYLKASREECIDLMESVEKIINKV